MAPSWNVFGKAPSNMVNSGVFSSNREMSTICAAWKEKHSSETSVQHGLIECSLTSFLKERASV